MEKSELKSGVILSYINIFLGNLIPIFYTPVMLRILGADEYGLYKLASGLTSYMSLITLGVGSAITRYLIKARIENNKNEEEKMLGLFLRIFKFFALVTLVIGLLLTFNLQIWYDSSFNDVQLLKMKFLVFLMVINMGINVLLTPYISVVNAHEKFIFMQSMNILSTCILPLLNLILLYFGWKSIGLVIGSLCISVVVNLCNYIYVRKFLNIIPIYEKTPCNLVKEIFSFSFWIFLSNVVNQLYNATDTLMIGADPQLSAKGVAVYNIGIVFVGIAGTLSSGIVNVLAPKTNKMVFSESSEEEITDFSIFIGRIQAYILTLIATGFIAFGRPFISFYAGSEFYDSFWIAIFVMIPNIIPALQGVHLNVLIAKNKHKFRSLVYLGIAVLNVIGTWVALKYMGTIGAALVSGIALLLGPGLIMNLYYWKNIELNIPKFWKEIGKVFVIPCAMCCITIWLGQYCNFYDLKILIMSIVIYTFVFVVLNYLFVMNDKEKRIVHNILKL